MRGAAGAGETEMPAAASEAAAERVGSGARLDSMEMGFGAAEVRSGGVAAGASVAG